MEEVIQALGSENKLKIKYAGINFPNGNMAHVTFEILSTEHTSGDACKKHATLVLEVTRYASEDDSGRPDHDRIVATAAQNLSRDFNKIADILAEYK